MSSDRFFGEIAGVPPGTTFPSRGELRARRVHLPLRSGISGSGTEGADSIVASGGYEDDQDFGNFIIYTGHGGRDPATGKQVADQKFEVGNRALARSQAEGLPIRVIRGSKIDSPHAPKSGYRYDGLYFVEKYWQKQGSHGHLVWLYRLVRDDAFPDVLDNAASLPPGTKKPPRRKTTVQHVVRSTAVAQQIKKLHGHACQACGVQLTVPAGPYAQGAHIRPLGRPHNGPDTPDNILCLCPNHHVLFDLGALVISDDLMFVDPLSGQERRKLRTHPKHTISLDQLAYQRGLFGG